MDELHELREMLMRELRNLTEKGDMNSSILDTVNKLTHSIKSIDTIVAMEETGYSNRYANDGHMMDGISYENRDSRGRYSRTGNRYSRRDYSRKDRNDLVNELRELMNEATDARTRKAIQNAIHDMED